MIVSLDANCVIYLVERNPTWGPKVSVRLATLRQAGDQIAVSDLVWTEALVGPIKGGRAAVLAAYRAFFNDPAVQVLPLTSAVCERRPRSGRLRIQKFRTRCIWPPPSNTGAACF